MFKSEVLRFDKGKKKRKRSVLLGCVGRRSRRDEAQRTINGSRGLPENQTSEIALSLHTTTAKVKSRLTVLQEGGALIQEGWNTITPAYLVRHLRKGSSQR